MELLAQGASKDRILAETSMVVGLNDVSLSVPSGAIYMIMGLSGSGKSTLARCINRLNEPTAGKILLDGQDIVTLNDKDLREIRRTRISMVFQHFALLPNKSIIENTEFGLKLRGIPLAQRRQRAEEVLSVVGLSKWAYHYPHELSGGMRQRVGLARALTTDADVLIMDEAFSALDPLIRSEMQDELLRLQRTLKKTILFITHDFQEALKLGTRIAIMADGQVVREGTPQSIVLEPGSEYVCGFTREVDRSRLFDARSVMQSAATVMDSDAGRIVADQKALRQGGFVLTASNRVIGVLDAQSLRQVRAGEPATNLLSTNFVSVAADAKLIDVARLLKNDQPVAVIDEGGAFLGTLEPENILECIGTVSSPRNLLQEGARHA
ncbi:proline/glycine betaine ABC transporter ATP-binding protein [Pseudomonas daroniae]|uniref:Quaternary amine transport ATP-binding protein n=2 Tax=Pseudomonadales TaxID=72274 RepID=A0A4V2KAF0_9GAMM|nr:proline/glycine betaine ABC transporter ATP-binding protein [Pseudomonas daroniae]TBU74885.1 proline/glycine betaine ABC transporter ATP-binding protein [Pseudomonas daroniae]TBU79998.1 proline/glycine betaine ABC transporter ATP-binding protein [Pseudomonas sp. FRB 228]TBU88979.1 proline/glycine betaine ABC transporter ATP-binding protein [Pseudomonas daroniae]